MNTFIKILGISSFAFLAIFIPSVSANTTGISFDPSYAEGPFIFWCAPYVHSFEEGKHYEPTNGSSCIYSIPETVGGNKRVAIYRGTVENSTFVASDVVVGNPTLVQENSVGFLGINQDEPLFAVIYDSALNEGGVAFDEYLRTGGTPPAGAVENQNYYILPWKWGAKPPEEFDPVIIVPDILNSWITDQGPVIDPVFNTYNNLIDTLTSNGYIEGQTLFTLPYNWEESYTSLAGALDNAIQSAKNTCGCSLVDIVAHGASSLSVVDYLSDTNYQNDVDQVVFLGPPFNGIPAAYAAWEAGLIQFDTPLRNGAAQALLTHQAETAGFSSTFDYIQNNPVSSFKDILPVTSYLSGKSYPTGYPTNPFLENIQNDFGPIFSLVRIHQFDSDSSSANTPDTFSVINSTTPPLWPHGEVTNTQFASGDGMVPYFSAEFFVSSDVYLNNITHHNIPTIAAGNIFEVLSGSAPTTLVNNSYPTSCVLFLTVSQGTDLQLTDPDNKRLGKDFTSSGNFAEIDRSIYSGPNLDAEYLAVANPVEGTYQVKTQGDSNGSFTLTATDVCNNGTHSTSTVGTTAPGQIVGYNVTVASDNTLDIETLDNQAPVVTINTPAQGAAYFSNDNVVPSVSISDPEGSPIADTVYTLNGSATNPLQPLPLSTQSLGLATFIVKATDVFGNIGYATSTFTIETPPEVENTLAVSADTYLRGIASDTNEGASPILRIQGAGDNRIVVKVDQQDLQNMVGNGTVLSATLEFEIEGTRPNWGDNGREVVINRLLMDWTEGNGKNAELPLRDRYRGSGAGATWNCATDSDIRNTRKDCGLVDDWNMRLLQKLQNLSFPWADPETDGVFVQKGQQGVISFDVTADVQAFLSGTENDGWIVRKSLQNRPGYISFYSRETGVTGPRLILNYTPGN